MADLIDRQALLEEIDDRISNIAFTSPYQDRIDIIVDGMERVRDSVEYAPAVDAVEVVRCKDCGWRDRDSLCEYFDDNDYCNRGKRRVDDV